jgi:hypothetical protein
MRMRRIGRMQEQLQLKSRLSDALPDQLTNPLILLGVRHERLDAAGLQKKLRVLSCSQFRCGAGSCGGWSTLQL